MKAFRICGNGFIKVVDGDNNYTVFCSAVMVNGLISDGFEKIN